MIKANNKFINVTDSKNEFESMMNSKIAELKNELNFITNKIENYWMLASEKNKIKLLIKKENIQMQIKNNEDKMLNSDQKIIKRKRKNEKTNTKTFKFSTFWQSKQSYH